jgi:hypothetical protein
MRYIELTKGYLTAVDAELVDILNNYMWHVLDSHPRICYAARWIVGTAPRKSMRMHHQVLDVESHWLTENDLVVDHIDRDGLNNTIENLRIVSRSINAKNCERWDNASWIRWDRYRERYKVVHKDGAFIAWCKTLPKAVEIRNANHQNTRG